MAMSDNLLIVGGSGPKSFLSLNDAGNLLRDDSGALRRQPHRRVESALHRRPGARRARP
ncbi:MAG: hypothetical protein VCF24_07925 [Candidatus Latescibacterota bacterium]